MSNLKKLEQKPLKTCRLRDQDRCACSEVCVKLNAGDPTPTVPTHASNTEYLFHCPLHEATVNSAKAQLSACTFA